TSTRVRALSASPSTGACSRIRRPCRCRRSALEPSFGRVDSRTAGGAGVAPIGPQRQLEAIRRLLAGCRDAATPELVADLVGATARRLLAADLAWVGVWDPGQDRLLTLSSLEQTLGLSCDSPLTRAFLLRQPVVIADHPAWAARNSSARIQGLGSILAVPLGKDSSVIGSLAIGTAAPREYRPDEVEALADLAIDAAALLSMVGARQHEKLRAVVDNTP